MRSLRTNLIKVEIASKYNQYQIQLSCKQAIQSNHYDQLFTFISQQLPEAAYNHPYIYSIDILQKNTLFTHFSNGCAVKIDLILIERNKQSKNIIQYLCKKMIRMTNLLYCSELDLVINPFQEINKISYKQMPGWKIGGWNNQDSSNIAVVWIQALSVVIESYQKINQNSNVLMDYSNGDFYLKQNVVRVDKLKGQAIFRNNTKTRLDSLRPIKTYPLNAYNLANQIYHLFQRIKSCCVDLFKKWQIVFDTRFIESKGQFCSPGSITLRDNVSLSLAGIITPMNQHNYIYSLIKSFQKKSFHDIVQAQLVFLFEQDLKNIAKNIVKTFDQIKKQMSLLVSFKILPAVDFSKTQQLQYIIRNDMINSGGSKMFVFLHSSSDDRLLKQQFQKYLQFMINNNFLYHNIPLHVDNVIQQSDLPAFVYKHLAIIYTKLRINPWTIKQIPFLNSPMAVISLSIQYTKQKLLSVALIGTMNLYFTKFSAFHRLISAQHIKNTIEEMIKQFVQKFKQAHKRYPQRIFIFRVDKKSQQKFDWTSIRNNFLTFGINVVAITVSQNHPVRTYYQMDANSVTRDNIKKVQNLFWCNIYNDVYIQLQQQSPPNKIKVYDVQPNDPSFINKILQLICRCVFGGVGNSYGKGLGILGYAQKLNAYRQFNLQPWKVSLRQGILLFL